MHTMEHEPKMKVVGGKNLPSHWERFDRLQRTAQALLDRPISPKGVFRFKTFEEFNEWKDAINKQDHPRKPVS